MPKSDTEYKRDQRERDRKAGLVRYERRIKPEWKQPLDKLLAKLKKH